MRHQLRVLLRNFRRERLYTAINIAGLALGLASCLLLGLFLRSELTYDRHYPNHRNIYRVVTEITSNGKPMTVAMAADAFGPMVAEEYPEQVLGYVRFRPTTQAGGTAMRRPEQPESVFFWENSYVADANVFEVFPVQAVHGDPRTALVDGASVAISQTVARRYFGDANPLGRQLVSDSGQPTSVTLVFRDQPPNTHLKYDLLFSYNQTDMKIGDTPAQRRQRLVAINGFTYLVMHPSFRPTVWQRMNQDFVAKYMGAELRGSGVQVRNLLQRLASTHMQTEAGYDRPNGNAAQVYGCAAVALIILMITCINYMNLATARAAHRARSVALRKILGASRASLAAGLLAEALLFAVVALTLAVAAVEVALEVTPVAELFNHKVSLDLLREPVLGLWLVAIGLATGLLSGAYPALYQSSWAPLSALAGARQAARGNLRLRELLVLVQFAFSALAITCTLLMTAQLHYMATRPPGFERAHRLLVPLRGATTIEKIPAIRHALLRDAGIRGVAVALQTPADGNKSVDLRSFQVEQEDGAMGEQVFSIQEIGQDYEKVLGLTITRGRDLSSRPQGDAAAGMLVNEALVRKMGWRDPIGKRLAAGGYGSGRVVGVVRDFNFKTLHHQIEPLVMIALRNDMSTVPVTSRPLQQRQLILQIAPSGSRRALEHVRRVMAEADPNHAVEYRFLDEALDALYGAERNLARIIGIFAAISILIACLGLYGLATFTTAQRSREIGTRKVLGATAWQIVGLLARRILMLVLIAVVIADVAAYFVVDQWLQGFAYRNGLNPLLFLLSAALVAALAFATVAAQAWRTANADPVQALRRT